VVKKTFTAVLFFLLGIGRNLPYEDLFVFGLGIADLLLILFFITSYAYENSKWQSLVSQNNGLLHFMFFFLIWNLFSTTINAPFFGIHVLDIFECLRIIYLIVILLTTIFLTVKYKIIPGISFVSGVAFSGFIAYLNPMNPDVLGIVQIFNPNVIGNILSFSCLFLVLLMYLGANKLLSLFLFTICFSFAIFTYSKATWLMLIISLLALFIYLKQYYSLLTRIRKILIIGLLLAIGSYIGTRDEFKASIELGEVIIDSKIENSKFGSSASEGSSVGARYGLSYSGFYMFLQSPIWGVGVGNFEKVNDENKYELGNNYFKDDNANSLIFHLLGTIGIVGLLIFLKIIHLFYKKSIHLGRLYNIPKLYNYLLISIFLISINFQRELLTSYYFWIIFGTTIGFLIIKTNKISKTNE
jgi:O-antigen ligase